MASATVRANASAPVACGSEKLCTLATEIGLVIGIGDSLRTLFFAEFKLARFGRIEDWQVDLRKPFSIDGDLVWVRSRFPWVW
jgi:hypothetical protein